MNGGCFIFVLKYFSSDYRELENVVHIMIARRERKGGWRYIGTTQGKS